MLEIIPAIIPKSLEDLEQKLSRIHQISPVVQIDITDGKFVPEASWPFRSEAEHNDFLEIVRGEKDLPYAGEFYFEADLMVKHPEEQIENFALAGFSRLIVHIESDKDTQRAIERAEEFNVEIGIAIGIDTPLEELELYADRVNVVQCMGISEIGFQGKPFDVRVVEKIAQLRAMYPKLIISVDGGVSLKSASLLLGAGADRLAVGSALFEAEDIRQQLEEFYKLENTRDDI